MKSQILALVVLLTVTTANAMQSGRWEQKLANGSTDILIVDQRGNLSLEHTRQVGGPGGISNDGVVPYPTVCRVKEWGKITTETSQHLSYQASYVHMTDLTGLQSTEHCARYVGEFIGRAQTQGLNFSVNKSEFTFVKP